MPSFPSLLPHNLTSHGISPKTYAKTHLCSCHVLGSSRKLFQQRRLFTPVASLLFHNPSSLSIFPQPLLFLFFLSFTHWRVVFFSIPPQMTSSILLSSQRKSHSDGCCHLSAPFALQYFVSDELIVSTPYERLRRVAFALLPRCSYFYKAHVVIFKVWVSVDTLDSTVVSKLSCSGCQKTCQR